MPKSFKERIDLLKQSDARYWRRRLPRRLEGSWFMSQTFLGLSAKWPASNNDAASRSSFSTSSKSGEVQKRDNAHRRRWRASLSCRTLPPHMEQRLRRKSLHNRRLERKAEPKGILGHSLPSPFRHASIQPLRGASFMEPCLHSDSAKYLTDGWKRVRAMLAKSKTDVCGVRVAEAHADGCFTHIF